MVATKGSKASAFVGDALVRRIRDDLGGDESIKQKLGANPLRTLEELSARFSTMLADRSTPIAAGHYGPFKRLVNQRRSDAEEN